MLQERSGIEFVEWRTCSIRKRLTSRQTAYTRIPISSSTALTDDYANARAWLRVGAGGFHWFSFPLMVAASSHPLGRRPPWVRNVCLGVGARAVRSVKSRRLRSDAAGRRACACAGPVCEGDRGPAQAPTLRTVWLFAAFVRDSCPTASLRLFATVPGRRGAQQFLKADTHPHETHPISPLRSASFFGASCVCRRSHRAVASLARSGRKRGGRPNL